MAILNENCAACHEGVVSGGISSILEINQLVASGLVMPGDRVRADYLELSRTASMPKGNGARRTAADVQTQKIDQLMTLADTVMNLPPLPTRAGLAPTLLESMRMSLRQVPFMSRPSLKRHLSI